MDIVLNFVQTYSDAITAVATVLLAFITIGLVLFGFVQTGTTRKQLRAYISVDETENEDGRTLKLETNGDITGIAMAKNHGQTPAHDIFTKIELGCVKSPLDPEFEFPKITYLSYPEGGVLHPNQNHYLKGVWSPPLGAPILTDAEFRNTLTKHGPGPHWHIFGFVSYRDIFGTKHFTKFCFQILWENGPYKAPGWFLSKQYNETDRNKLSFITRLDKFLRTPFIWGAYMGSIVCSGWVRVRLD